MVSVDKKKNLMYRGREAPQDSNYVLMKYNPDDKSFTEPRFNKEYFNNLDIIDFTIDQFININAYSTNYETYYAKDIVVPYINIDSAYAKASNNNIKEIFDSVINEYNNGVNDKITYVDECNYKKYVNNDKLSVILTYGIGATDVVHPKYYTYNFDLKTGSQLSYEEIYKIAGFDSSTINSKVEAAITKIMEEKMSSFSADNYPTGTTFDTYNSESINNYKNSINNDTLEYFLSDNNKLNIIVKLNIPAGTGEFDTIIAID